MEVVRAWFRCLLWHPDMQQIGSILTILEPTRGGVALLSKHFYYVIVVGSSCLAIFSFIQCLWVMFWWRISLGAAFSGLILEAPFNNLVEAANNHPLTAVCYRVVWFTIWIDLVCLISQCVWIHFGKNNHIFDAIFNTIKHWFYSGRNMI